MLNALFQFEWRYHIHQKSFLFGFSIFLVLGFVLPIAQAGMDTRVFINAPYNIAWQLGLSSLGAGFVLAVIASNGMLRDVTHNTVQLVYTTPVKKGHMLFSPNRRRICRQLSDLRRSPARHACQRFYCQCARHHPRAHQSTGLSLGIWRSCAAIHVFPWSHPGDRRVGDPKPVGNLNCCPGSIHRVFHRCYICRITDNGQCSSGQS